MAIENPRAIDIARAALDIRADAERQTYLDAACAGDIALRAQVEDLVRAAGEPSSVTGAYTPQPDADEPPVSPDHLLGTSIGPYRLVELIGEGGMGSVYRAEQTEPVTRSIAVKLIKAGMDTRHVLARFEAERQALALMDHPNIAKVLDAGAVPPGANATGLAGKPYFVMELVRGVPITRYCDEHRLTPRQRLELFVPVCQAIQHAHQKGIIHRDIKPSNVLVASYDDKPVPKVIDFGVAKATGGQFAADTAFTGIGNIVGTPEYMSPEQAEPTQLDIDTRSDVYALGVLLYELLTGSTPIDRRRLRNAAFLEVLRVIREEEPPRPSTKLSSSDALPSIAANRQMEPARLTRLVRGELDWIVMKALEKDRDRRYATANGFAADVQRYLADEPVLAGPPSKIYRLRKFVRRNRGPVLAATLLLLALVGGIVGTSIGLVRAERAREAEQGQRVRAETIASFMQTTLEGAAPAVAKGRDRTLLNELMDGAARRIDEGKLGGDPEAEASLRRTIGTVYVALGEWDAGEKHLRKSVALAKAAYGETDGRVDDTEMDLADCLVFRGRFDDVKAIAQRVLANCDRRGEADSQRAATAWDFVGQCDYNLSGGSVVEAEKVYRKALAIRRRIFPPGSAEIGESLDRVSFALKARSAFDEAEPIAREALEIRRTVNGPLHPETIFQACSMADLLIWRSKYSEAEALMRSTLPDAEKVFGPNHRGVADVLWRLGDVVSIRGDFNAAEPFLTRCLAIRRQTYPGDHKEVASALEVLARLKLRQGDGAGAEPLFRESLKMRRALFGEKTAVVAVSVEDLGLSLSASGRHADAKPLLEEAVATWREIRPDCSETVHAVTSLALEFEKTGDLDRAIDLYGQAVDLNVKLLGPDAIDVGVSLSNQGAALFRRGRKQEAEQRFRRALDIMNKKAGGAHPKMLKPLGNLAALLEDRGDFAGAEALHREFLATQKSLVGADHPAVASAMVSYGENLIKQNRLVDAEGLWRESLAIRTKHEPDVWTTFNAQSMLGDLLTDEKKYAEAEPLLLGGYQGIKMREAKIPSSLRPARLSQALERLAKFYDATGKPAEAAKWRAEIEKLKAPAEKPKK